MTIPAVQTKLAQYFTFRINEDKKVSIYIDKIQIKLNGKIIIKDFYILDEQNDTMIAGKRLETFLKNPFQLQKENKLHFGRTHLDGLKGNIIVYKGNKKPNIEIFVDKLDSSSSSGKKTNPPFELKIKKIKLTDAHLKYSDYNNSTPEIIDLYKMQSEINGFYIKGPKVHFALNNTSFIEKHGLQVNRFSTDFTYTKKQMKLNKTHLLTPYSTLHLDLVFEAPEGYKDFNNKVKLNGKITNTQISTNDLLLFTDVFSPGHSLAFNSILGGTMNKILLTDYQLSTDNQIQLKGAATLYKIFDSKHLQTRWDFNHLSFSFPELVEILEPVLKNSIPSSFYTAGNIQGRGKLFYKNNHLESAMDLQSSLGELDFDLLMNDFETDKITSYKARAQTKNFDLSKIAGIGIKLLTGKFQIVGKGLSLHKLNSHFNGEIEQMEFKKYLYRNLSVDGNVRKKRFEGRFDINDPNLDMDFTGLIDFSGKKNRMNFSTEICHADLHKIHLIQRDTISELKGFIDINAQGNTPDDITGKVVLKDFYYKNQFSEYAFNDFTAISEVVDSVKNIHFISNDILSGDIKGKFTYEKIPLLLKNAIGSVFANYKPIPLEDRQYIRYKLQLHNKIVSLFYPDLEISSHTSFQGKLDSKGNIFKMRLKSGEIDYSQNTLKNIYLDIDNKNPIYNLFLKIDSIHTPVYKIKDFKLLNTTIKDTLYLKSVFTGGDNYKDKYDISFFYTMDEAKNFIVGLQKSIFNFKEIPWYIDPEHNKNKILYSTTKDSLLVEDIGIFHNEEQININGFKTPKKLNLNIDLHKINLKHLSPDLEEFVFEGIVNGNINFNKYGNEILPKAVLKIKNFKMNGESLGDVSLKIHTLKGNLVFLDIVFNKKGTQLAKINGYIDFSKKKPLVNASIFLQDFPVKTLEPLFKDIFANVRGKWTGNIQVKGPIDNLSFTGKIYLSHFGLKILALNVDYEFKNNTVVILKGQEFILKDAEFEDTKMHTKGYLSGVIKHHNFDNWYLDLHIKTDKLLVLDTPENPEELFYGQVVVKGDARIHGYVNHLKIDANMQTLKGTEFVLTLNDVETEGEDDFIRILSKEEFKKEKKKQKRKKIRKVYEGLEMNFDLDITPDAEVKIILDQEFGSYLKAKGSGAMLLEINTNGRFNIWGDYTVLEGIYNFKYAGIIDKKFQVEPGSYISWEGDPYEANLDIKAVYETLADPYVLIPEQQTDTHNNMPVDVIIYLKDKLTQPKITFDLELPKANTILKSQIDYILSDPDKKNLQVLSLLSFGNFINENDYNLNKQLGEGAVETLSERGLNLLNALMSQDENFKVNLKYKGGTNDLKTNIKNDPQVGLSLTTKISKRIYINGSIAIPVGRYTKSSIVGDMEIEVYLDKEGHLKFRVFNKQTELEYAGQQEGYTQGIGLSYEVEFDTFKEILEKFGIKIKEEKESN